ncbi:hypothetical protein MBEHAL_2676 [Halarchaeum acidiphilum MH1-52-1]|uniref:Uncharacterized protein n=1 Tax=Halarchaeum acidiphilum MH1-52-1 TaxID=1261545 RepID=U2YHF2_9EURY|nr:hypothetical protein [Halarchaeum acidiphilum]GAD53916.1 hypothetical protein MBEHAL_2676 [Halarchaeum acidiphilum MH1-52-1]
MKRGYVPLLLAVGCAMAGGLAFGAGGPLAAGALSGYAYGDVPRSQRRRSNSK